MHPARAAAIADDPMAPHKPDRSLFLLGKYMSLVFLVPGTALAGYVGARLLEDWLHRTGFVVWGLLFGVVAGLVKVVQEVLADARAEQRASGNNRVSEKGGSDRTRKP